MKCLFTTIPGLAHLHPTLPVAQAVVDAGHDVAFAVPEGFRQPVENAGFQAFPAGINWRAEAQEEAFPECKDFPPKEYGLFFLKNIVSRRCPPAVADDVLRLAETWRPDLIVHDFWEFGGGVAAEALDIPHAVLALSGGSIRIPYEMARKVLVEPLDEVRQRYGLAPDPELEMLDRYLRLELVPPSYDVPKEALQSKVTHRIRRVSYDRTVTADVPDWLDELPHDKTILVTLGTVFNRHPEVFQTIVDSLRDEPVNLIVTVGSNQDPSFLGPQPDHIRVERYIPYTLLFPRLDAMIVAGGSTTVLSALAEAVPLIFVPEAADHPVNAELYTRLGAALTLARDDLRPEEIRRAARDILDNPTYREGAARVRDQMLAQPGPEHAAQLLVRLAREKKAIPTPADHPSA